MNDSIITIAGDVCDATEPYIAHQCNCRTIGEAAGAAKAIFARYPFANTYTTSYPFRIPGTHDINYGMLPSTKCVVNLYGQDYPGRPGFHETREKRLDWFQSALYGFIKEECGPRRLDIAMPYLIGCGLAGGHWPDYLKVLETATQLAHVRFFLYQL